MAEKNSLWKNIRNKAAKNRRTGATPKEPTKEMLRQERKIKAKKADGGPVGDDDLMLSKIYSKYPAFKNMGNVTLKADTGFTREKTGLGEIEYFNPNQNTITYPNGYNYPHPNLGTHGIVYNPNMANPEEAVRLDLLHGMPYSDKAYAKHRDEFGKSFKKQNQEEIDYWWNKDREKYGDGDGKESFEKNYIDGVVRGLLLQGKPEDMGYSAEANKYYLQNPEISKREKQLENYLQVGKGYMLPEVEIFSDQSLAQGGYMYPDGGKTKVYTDPDEFKKANQAYSDSLSLYNTTKPFINELNRQNRTKTYNDYVLSQFQADNLGIFKSNPLYSPWGSVIGQSPTSRLPISSSNINPVSYTTIQAGSQPYRVGMYKKPSVKPILEKRNLRPNIDNLQSKRYTGDSDNMSIIGSTQPMPPTASMDASPDGHYRITRPSTYGEPQYQVWTSGNKWKDVSNEEFKKLNEENYLTEYSKGGLFVGYAKGGKYLTADGIAHRVYRGADGDIMVNHPKNDYGKWDTLNLTDKSNANTIAEGVASVRKWHRENPSHAQGGYMYPEGGEYIYTPDTGIEQYAPDQSWYEGNPNAADPSNIISWPSYPNRVTPSTNEPIKSINYPNFRKFFNHFKKKEEPEIKREHHGVMIHKPINPKDKEYFEKYKAEHGYYAEGGGVGEDKPVTLYNKAYYNPDQDRIIPYAGSQDNKYYQLPGDEMIQSRLPEFEIIEDTGLYNPNVVGPAASRYMPSETGLVQNPNFRGGDALEYVPIGAALLPASLPFKATSGLGKAALFAAETQNPGLGLGNSLRQLERNITINALNSKPVLKAREAIIKKIQENASNVKGSLYDEKNIERLRRTGFIKSGDSQIFSFDGSTTYDPLTGSLYDSKPGSGELRKHFSRLYGKPSTEEKLYFVNFNNGNFNAKMKLPEGDKPGRISGFNFFNNSKSDAGRTALALEKLAENIPGKWEFNPGTVSGDSYPMWMNLLNRRKDLDKFGINISTRAGHLNSFGRYGPIPKELEKPYLNPPEVTDWTRIHNEIKKDFSTVFDKYNAPEAKEYFIELLENNPTSLYHPNVTLIKKKAQGGYTNPYMYYSGGPMQYEVGGKVWKNIAAGLYGAGEGILDTITMGATDQLTDRGFDYLTKVGNKNIDLNNPDDVKFLKTQQQVKGYSNTAGAIGTAVVTGNVQGAITQGTKGLNTAFQASDWASDDFKKWSQGVSGVAGLAAGFAGGLNSDSFNAAQQAAQKAGSVKTFGQKASMLGSFGNQAMGMIGGNQQPLWQQGEARQEYLNSPEYLAMKDRQNQQYVNQGLSFSNGGNVNNNSLNLQNSMRNRYNSYRKKSKGGTFHQYGINQIPDSAGLHHQNAYGGVPIGQDAMAEGGEYVLDDNYVVSDQVDGMNTQTDEFGNTMAENLKTRLNKYTLRDLDSKNKGELRRPNDSIAQNTIDQIKQQAMMETEMARAEAQAQEEQNMAMREAAVQYAAAGGKLNKDITKIVEEEYAAAYGGQINPKKYKGLNMPYSGGGKLPKEVLRARVEAHMSPQEADAYVKQYGEGGGIHIKESKKGTFTAAATKHGKSVQEFARQVLANKDNYSSKMVQKANFARNAAGWKHAEGGQMDPPDKPMITNKQVLNYIIDMNERGMLEPGRPFETSWHSNLEDRDIDLKKELSPVDLQRVKSMYNYKQNSRNKNPFGLMSPLGFAQGGPLYGDSGSPYTYAMGGDKNKPWTAPIPIKSTVQQGTNSALSAGYGNNDAANTEFGSRIINEYGNGLPNDTSYIYQSNRMGNNPGTEDYFYNTGQNTQDGKPISNYNSGSVAPFSANVYQDRIKRLAGYAEGGPMVSNVPQPFNGPSAQNRGGMMVEYGRGGIMYDGGGQFGFGTGTPEILYAPQNPIQYTTVGENTFDLTDPFASQNTKEINLPDSNSFTQGTIPIDIQNIVSNKINNNNSDSTTPWSEEPWYSKAARYSQALPGVAATITGLMNKKRKLTPERISPEQVNLERSRITAKEEGRRALDSGLKTVRGSSSNTGQLAGNTRDMILNYNKNMGANIAKSYETEENVNAQLRQQAALTNQQYGNAFKQLNEEMFQNAQTQALEGFKDTTSKLASTASEERKQYLQEWIARNKLKTRDFLQGPDGSYYYEGLDGKLVKVS